jgi:hypothetical protein
MNGGSYSSLKLPLDHDDDFEGPSGWDDEAKLYKMVEKVVEGLLWVESLKFDQYPEPFFLDNHQLACDERAFVKSHDDDLGWGKSKDLVSFVKERAVGIPWKELAAKKVEVARGMVAKLVERR